MVVHGSQLSRLGVFGIASIRDSFRRPYSNMTICVLISTNYPISSTCVLLQLKRTSTGCDQPGSVRGDMAAVDLEVFLVTCKARATTSVMSLCRAFSNGAGAGPSCDRPPWVNQSGLVKRITVASNSRLFEYYRMFWSSVAVARCFLEMRIC